MMSDLFRKEAQEEVQRRLEGRVILSCPVSLRLLSLLACILGLLILASAILGKYTYRQVVTGWISSSRGLSELRVQEEGTLSEVYVKEGDHVEKGQVLAIVSSDRNLSDGSTRSTLLLSSLEQEKQELEDRISALKSQNAASLQRLQEQRSAILERLRRGQRTVELQRRRIELVTRQAEAIQTLAQQGYATAAERARREEAVLSAEQSLALQEAEIIQIRTELRNLDAEIAELPLELRLAISEVQNRLPNLERQQIQTSTEGSYALRAPTAGRILAILNVKGESVSGGAPIITMLPSGSRLQAVLLAPTRAIGFLRPGQEVKLRYDAFPFERYGSADGSVASITHTVLDPADLGASTQITEPVYRVMADLESETFIADGVQIPLQPGMQLTAHIVLERRRFIWLLIDPLSRLTGR